MYNKFLKQFNIFEPTAQRTPVLHLIVTTGMEKSVIDLDENIRLITSAAFAMHEDEYPSIISREVGEYLIEQEMTYEGAGAAPERTEGADATEVDFEEGYTERIIHYEYSYDMPITSKTRDFITTNKQAINQMGMYQARSGKLRFEYSSAGVLNNGFSSSLQATGDGQAYYSSAHTWRSGGTYSNLLTPSDLDKNSLEDGLKTAANAKMENNIPASLKMARVVIAWENIFVLPELLKSSLDPESASNTYNVFKDFGLGKVLNHYLSDTDSWYLDDTSRKRIMKVRKPVKLGSYMDDKSRNLIETLDTTLGVGIFRVLGSYGNQGS